MKKKSAIKGDKLLTSSGNSNFRKVISMLHLSVFLMALCIVLGTSGNSFSQQMKTLTGKVTDSSGTSLPGVSVVVKGTTNGSITDSNGKYTLTNVPGNATLQFTFVGMKRQEITVGNKTSINVLMEEETVGLEEVVAIGYGTQKKATITGAVSEVKTEDLAKNAVADISNSIAGRLSGVIAVQSSGEPGNDAAQLLIRGQSTFNNSSPLVLVDGIERPFNHMDPNTIESMSVLKDASATAVYGVRGANGVILITTKRGTESKPTVTYSGYYGVQNPIRLPSLLNSYDYATLYNEALHNDDPTANPAYSADDIKKYKDHSDPYGHPDVDWNRAELNRNAPIQRHSLSVSGGAKAFRYFVSFGSIDQDGSISLNNFKTKSVRANLDIDITKTTKVSINLASSKENRAYPGLTGQYKILVANLRPNMSPVKWENESWAADALGGNLVAANLESGYQNWGNNTIQNSIVIDQKLDFVAKGLSFKVVGAYDAGFFKEKDWHTPYKLYNKTSTGEYEEVLAGGLKPSLNETSNETRSTAFEAHLNYKKRFGKSDVSGLLLYTQSAYYEDGFNAGRDQYGSAAIDQLFAGPLLNPTNGGSAAESGREGYVGRITYGYDSKYLAEANFGYNGSENFPTNKRFGFFPSAALGWVTSEENFMKSFEFINFLKIRASYGEVGNDKIGGRSFLYKQPFYYGAGYVLGGNSPIPVQSIYAGGLPNTMVTWEKAKKSNIGLDARLFGDLLGLRIDVFNEKRDNILATRNQSVPGTFGAELPVENIAKVNNNGFELELTHKYKIGDFQYSVVGNITYAHNKIIYIDEPENVPSWQKRTGLPIGQFFGYISEGLYMTQDQIDNHPKKETIAPQLGEIMFKDVNNDGKISELDITSIGHSRTPEIMYGINLNVKYKNFDLTALIQGAGRSSVIYSDESAFEFIYGSGALQTIKGRWTPDNPNPTYPRLSLYRNDYKKEASTYWLKDGAYWRVKNIELGYTLPKLWLERLQIENVRIYVAGTNLYTHAKFKDWDPESPGGSNFYYPQMKVNTIGLNVTF